MSSEKKSSLFLVARDVALGQLFALADTDKSGTLEARELVAMIQSVNPDKSESDIRKQFRELDKSKDGKLQKDEFVSAMLEHFKADSDQKFAERIEITKKFLVRKPALGQIFDAFDSDKSGSLDKGELYRMVKLNKPKVTNDEILSMIKAMDIDKDKRVNKPEFVQYFFAAFFSDSESEFENRVELTLKGRRKVKLEMVFHAYDTDGNGSLDIKEFGKMLTLNGRKFCSPDEIIDTLCQIDSDKNRKIDFSEWAQYMSKIISLWDDSHFNKAISNMLAAAKSEGTLVQTKDSKDSKDKKKETTKEEPKKP
jgi:Ca2+-binding EF-hand superfamily protein